MMRKLRTIIVNFALFFILLGIFLKLMSFFLEQGIVSLGLSLILALLAKKQIHFESN